MGLHLSSSIKVVFTDDKFAYISNRLPFGTTSVAAFCGCYSKIIYNIINSTITLKDKYILYLKPSNYLSYKGKTQVLLNSIPFIDSETLLFTPDISSLSTCDMYIDDFIGINIYQSSTDTTIDKFYNTMTNIFDLFFNTHSKNLPNDILQKVALSLRKLLGKGTPYEVKTILG